MKMVSPPVHTDDLLVASIIVLVFLLVFFVSAGSRWRFRYPRRAFWSKNLNAQFGRDITDVGQQIQAVMSGSFEKRRILSGPEYRLFLLVEREVIAQCPGWRVFAQTNLGEILSSTSQDAFHSINSKRVDILIVDRSGWPCIAVEYQGRAHYQGSAAARDAVKKEALRKAGVRYVEFCDADSEDYIRLCLRESLLKRQETAHKSP